MLRLIIYTCIIYSYVGCQLLDNTIKGQYGSTPATPVTGPIGLKLNLNDCSDTPPEALSYSCSLLPETLHGPIGGGTLSEKANANLNSVVSFELTQNSCTGLSLNSDGLLEGGIAKTVAETCSVSIRGSMDGFTVEETLNLTVAPSLSFSFTNENIYVQEGQGEISVDLVLSEPAPYDTFVEFDVYGDATQVLSGLSFITNKISILKGQSSVTLSLFVSPTSGINQVVYQQLRIKSGSVNPLPGVSINSYDSAVTLRSFEQIEAGGGHTCGIDGGMLFCWGSDDSGRIGNGGGSGPNVDTAEQIGSSNLWQSVRLGVNHSCGINDGKLYCWGSDDDGQVGNGGGTGPDVYAPEQIGSSITWQSLALGNSHSCGIDNGKLYCWGAYSYGKLGNGSIPGPDIDTPQQIGSSILWQSIALGEHTSCGIDNGKLYCWGRDNFGQVGNGSGSTADIDTPQQVGSSISWQSISVGKSHSCGIDGGKLYCWGRDLYGQVGNGSGSSIDVDEPQQIGSSSLWQSIDLGNYHSCGINDDKLFCWGKDGFGQLGNGSDSSVSAVTPQQIGSSDLWQSLSSGGSHTCGIDDDKLYCWGSDLAGQVGNGSGSSLSVAAPKQIGGSQLWQSVAAGFYHTCAIDNGKLFCWGGDATGQIGNGGINSADVATPQRIGSSILWQSIAAGQDHTCGIDGGLLFCWGRDTGSQIGNGGASSAHVLEPVQIGTSNTWESLALGFRHTCGINNGNLFCWGEDTDGQVGNGSSNSADVDTPQQIGSSSSWQSIAIGSNTTCGIDDGKLFCWGYDLYGELGNGSGSSADVLEPTQVGLSDLWQSIALGSNHNCGIDDGKLFCWGRDSDGQVGNGSSTSSTAPEQIGSSTTWQSLALGQSHSCGIDDGKLYCWGRDSSGQVGTGIGSVADVDSPQQIGPSNLWQSLALGSGHSCGIDEGKLHCWGGNGDGQVGQSSSLLGSPFLIIE